MKLLLAAPLLLTLLACRPPVAGIPSAGAGATELDADAAAWVESTLASLDVRRKAAQMVMVRANGYPYHPEAEDYRRLLAEVRELGVGGVVVFDSEVESLDRLLDGLQEAAELPLLVAADMERGMAFRARRGAVEIPFAMAIGATRSEELARWSGEVTARQGRALGIHWALAPVVDVNVDPANPIVNLRSYGEDPELVARLGAAFVAGARAGGLMTSAKHFPGHGDTAIDSHHALPVIEGDAARLEAVELAPFRRAIEAGVDSVMVGHLAVPALDPSATPATLSPELVDGLLRRRMGFGGLVVTDAMEMDGVAGVWAGAAAVRAVAAGADVVLLPPDPRVAVQSLARAVAEGELSEARLDASVRRILTAKARLGLHHRRLTDVDPLRHLADPADEARALDAARAAVTVVRNRGDVLPLTPSPLGAENPPRLLLVSLAGPRVHPREAGLPREEVAARDVDLEHVALGPEVSPETAEALVAAAPGFTHVVVSATVGPGRLSPSQKRLLESLVAAGPPTILVSFGSPYLLAAVPEVPVYVCAYGLVEPSRRAAVEALFGEIPTRGRLPVTVPGLYPYGHGLSLPANPMTLRHVPADGFDEVDRILDAYVERGAFPGGVVAVGYRGDLVHLRPFGRLSHDEDAPAVRADTIYDVASLTKVVATTTMAMILVDEGRLDLDAPVQDFLPRFRGAGKDAVTVRHLLIHTSGVEWWQPLYEEVRGKEAYLERIQAMELVYEPGSRSLYSDPGMILLGEILERVAGQPLDDFARERVFEPLGMGDTLFRPGPDLLERIAPTEHDPWRGRMVRGEVHDENAHALGGVAAHAGLFSTAPDLARFVQMILNGGVLEHRRIVSRRTLETFTRRAGVVPDSSRAIGWDTKSPEGSSAGSYFSPNSFGHTGFTGTSIWIDPERHLFLILLTNRVHPTRDNRLIREARPAVADAVIHALEGP